jgi:hypothetical protein
MNLERTRRRELPAIPPPCTHPNHLLPFSEEFARHGMSDIVTLTHRNVCKDGFTVTDTADAGAQFYFVVLSQPHSSLPSPFSLLGPPCSLGRH